MKASTAICALAFALTAQQLSAQPISPSLPSAVTDRSACELLASVTLPELTSIDARWIESTVTGSTGSGRNRSEQQTGVPLPAYCQLNGVIDPAIRIDVWLPSEEDWNGRFLGLGNQEPGVPTDAAYLEAAIQQGYAVAATDAGQGRQSIDWLNDDGQVRDFAYRAVFEMTAKAQALLSRFYGRPQDYAYFNGCSLGGRQALVEAQRFPTDYDGIVAGSPISAMVDTLAFQLWLEQRLRGGMRAASVLGPDELTLLNNAAIAQCDSLDGITDGRISSPQNCRIDPSRLQCGAGSGPCLDQVQVSTARSIYNGPVTLAAGSSIPGLAAGSEANWLATQGSQWIRLARGFLNQLELNGDDRSLPGFTIERDLAQAREQLGWMLDADGGDLMDFEAGNGKLIIYHGWNDTLTSPQSSRAFYDSIQPQPAIAFARLFMLPASPACPAGASDSPFPGQREIEDWVERAIPPTGISVSGARDLR